MENQINIEELTKLAEQGDDGAILKLADYYYDEGNYQTSLEFYFKLADQNNDEVLRHIGCCYDSLKEYELSFEQLLKSANLGNPKAQFSVGVCYDFGEGVEQDCEKAVEWYTKAAEQGIDDAQLNLAISYENGEGVEQNYEKAIEWYKKAIDNGVVPAITCLAYCYEAGNGVEQSYEKANELYAKAAELGNDRAQCNLGYNNQMGLGTKKDYKKAAEWYAMAAEQDYARGQYNLAVLYEYGSAGEQDYELAAYWYKKAAENDHEDAQKALDKLYEKGLVPKEDAPRIQDDEFGELVHYGYNLWKVNSTEMFNGNESKLLVELEGSADENVTDEQRKAYAEYQEKKANLYDATVAKAKQIFGKDCEITPKNLFIDRQGNYGWLCNNSYSSKKMVFTLSDGDVQFNTESVLYNYAEVIANRKNTNLKEGDTVFLNLFGEVVAKKNRLKGKVDMEWVDGGKLELLVGDNYEVTEAQKNAFIKYIVNPEEYYDQVRECLFKEFLYDYEDFTSRIIVRETEANHINNVTVDSLRKYYRYSSLVIDADGNLGFVLDCSWTESKEIAVLFTEEGLVALTPEMLRNVKKTKDPDFGLMLHGKYEISKIQVYRFGKVYTNITKEAGWIGLIPNEFSEKEPYMPVHLECKLDQQITPEQRAAYAEYLKNKEKHYADLQQLAKEVTEGTRGEGDVVVPKVLYIDRTGNYGWLVYVPWNENQRGVMLSDGELFFTKPGVFHNYNAYLNFKAKTEFSLGDTIFFELCKELIGVNLSAGGDNAYDENGNFRTDNKLSEEEKDLLNWVLENRNLDHIADELVEEANYRFNEWTEKDIEKIDLLEEMQLSTLRINIDEDGAPKYDVTISGNANWDGTAGVAITSSNRNFNGVTGESYVLQLKRFTNYRTASNFKESNYYCDSLKLDAFFIGTYNPVR